MIIVKIMYVDTARFGILFQKFIWVVDFNIFILIILQKSAELFTHKCNGWK